MFEKKSCPIWTLKSEDEFGHKIADFFWENGRIVSQGPGNSGEQSLKIWISVLLKRILNIFIRRFLARPGVGACGGR